jgi:Putative zinc-finger
MNCSQIEKFLPLYAGHDLDRRREHLVETHLETCVGCAVAVADYRAARELVRGLTLRVVGDDVYSEIRNNVWRRIERESRPSFFQSITVWFQPRFVWTAAAATLLIAVSIIGIYVVAQRSAMQTAAVANQPREVNQPKNEAVERLVNGPVDEREDNSIPPQRQAGVLKRRGKPDHLRAPDRGNSLVAYLPDTQVARSESSSPIVAREDSEFAAPNSEKSLRLEIQTNNPNIRIIWFAQQAAKPAAVHSKGI